MKKILLLIMPLLLLTACIHQHPDELQINDVSLVVELLPDLEFIPLPPINKSSEGLSPSGYQPRVVVEARRPGENTACLRMVVPVSEAQLTSPRFRLPVELPLRSVAYQLTVWLDYTQTDSLTDTHYRTANLRSVSHILPYEEDHQRRDAFLGNATVDLSGQEGQVVLPVDLRRPLAHYRLVATDVQKFLNKQQANGRPGSGQYDVRINYQYFLVTHLNAVTGEPVNSAGGFGYSRCITLNDTMDECELGADYILAGGQGSVTTIIIELREKDKQEPVLSKVINLEIPYLRGHTTIVRGAFLTAQGGGGGGGGGGLDIGIDGDYDGEINIEVK